MNLTEREQKMLAMLAQGKSGPQIAKACKLTEGTCRVYLHNIYRKLGVVNRTQAVDKYWGKHKRTCEFTNGPWSGSPARGGTGWWCDSCGAFIRCELTEAK